jgi:hypothetical protein
LPAFALAACAVLPGCLTGELWRGYAWPEPSVEQHLVGRRVQQQAGALAASAPVVANGLWWFGDGDGGDTRWWLCPEAWGGDSAEVAAALLADHDLCEVDAAAIDAVRRDVSGELFPGEATLTLTLRIRSGALGEVVPAADVPPGVAASLAAMQRNAYLPPADPHAHLPPAFRRCVERLARLDLGGLVGERFPVYAEAWSFVDAAGRPAFLDGDGAATARPAEPGADAAAAGPPAEGSAETTLAERLAALRKLSLLVRVQRGGEAAILRLRPDRVWLASALDGDGGRCVHRSRWRLRSAPGPAAVPSADDAPRIASSLRLQEERHRRTIRPAVFDEGLLARVALTPLALAADLALGPGVGDFLRWLSGRGPRAGTERRPGD